MAQPSRQKYHFYPHDTEQMIQQLGSKTLLRSLEQMLQIRNFEIRGESAYQHGLVGGFFHSYMGQEAIQTAAVLALGPNNWYATSYRCHALALLLGVTPNAAMAELYGRATGNAKGRGGSMHFYAERLLGGFGIVGGQIPIATGAAFTCKYLKKKEEVAICFFGEGAVAQGAFHESLNLASLWDLPCIYVIENNQWGMGTAVSRAISSDPIAESQALGYHIKSYTLDGMNFFNCYHGFKEAYAEVKKTSRPVLIEAVCERFRGHSISDPGMYRSKESLQQCMGRDPIAILKQELIARKMLTEEEYKAMDKQQRDIAIAAMEFAEQSPFPDVATLEENVFAE